MSSPTGSSGAPDFTFVTVAHHVDEGFMRLQARSLGRYLDPDLAAAILVIENPQPGHPVRWRELLFEEYGAIAARVRFAEAREIAAIPRRVGGWVSQQILKLAVAGAVSTPRYVVLDAKNHLIRPLARNWLEAADGRPRSALVDYRTHAMRDRLRDTLAYFSLPLEPHLRSFLPSATPFALPTATVRELMSYVERREGVPFPRVFAQRGESVTEFFLLAAYVVATRGRLDSTYDLTGTLCETVWPDSGERAVLDAVARSDTSPLPFFGVHRLAVPQLSERARRAIEDLWRSRALVAPGDAGLDLLRPPYFA